MIKLEKPFFWSLLAFVFLIPIFPSISTKLMVLLVAFSFFLFESKFNLGSFLARAWDTILYLLVLFAGLFYSMDLSNGLKVLETNFSFIAIPIVFSRIKYFTEKELFKLLTAFTAGLSVACVIYMVNATVLYDRYRMSDVFFFYQLTDILDSHPTYLAYYLIFAITYALYILFYQKSKVNPYFVGIVILFFFLILMLTGGRTAFISLLLVFSFFILKFLLENRVKSKSLTLGLVLFMMISMFVGTVDKQESRNSVLNDSWDRLALWKSAIDANSNFIFGVGTGDHKIVLNTYYNSHDLKEFAVSSFNSHNQFIQIFLSNGMLGLTALIILLARPLYYSATQNYALGILVFFPFIIYGVTEVFLGRYQGIVFFALLHQMFISYYLSAKPSFTLKYS